MNVVLLYSALLATEHFLTPRRFLGSLSSQTKVDSAPKKEGISDSMRARLMQEAATGLDADRKQTNVLLYIILGVAVLVVLGGAGILY
jgi:hypothetical protein